MIGALTCVLALAGVLVYHFFLGGAGGVEATAGRGGASSKSLFGRKFGNEGPGLEINQDEMKAMAALPAGTGSGGRAGPWADKKPENYREQRRLYAFTKIDGVNRQMDERRKALTDLVNRRNSPSGLALKDAIESIDQLDNLGILKLESMLKSELQKNGTDETNRDLLVFGYQTLAETLAKKAAQSPTQELQERTREAMKQYLSLLKQGSPPEAAGSIDHALGELSGPLPTRGAVNPPSAPGN